MPCGKNIIFEPLERTSVMKKSLLWLSLVLVFVPSWGGNGGLRPNILFIEVDDLSYEYVGANGAVYPSTPHIDRLVKEGVYFRDAVAQGMMCGPSRNSLITGLYPHSLGFYFNGQMKNLPRGEWTFPAALQRAGYHTAWIGKCHVRPYIAPGTNKTEAMKKEMGFDEVWQTLGRGMLCKKVLGGKTKGHDWYLDFLKEKGLLETFKAECRKPTTLPEDVYLDGFFTRKTIDFLQNYHGKKPFFLWLNYSLPHDPYDVPEAYQIYDPARMKGGTRVKNYTEPEGLVKKTKPAKSERVIRQRQAKYCANVAYLDREVGRVLQTLRETGLDTATVVVFFSDQGLMMGDHERFHKGTLFRQITDPVLIMVWPGHFREGFVAEGPVELTDLVRTILELAGAEKNDVERRPWSFSLMPALITGDKVKRKVAFAEIEGYAMASDGQYRLIRGKDAVLLFDDHEDPDNLLDIAAEHPEAVERLSKAIDQWYRLTGEPLPPHSF